MGQQLGYVTDSLCRQPMEHVLEVLIRVKKPGSSLKSQSPKVLGNHTDPLYRQRQFRSAGPGVLFAATRFK